MYKVPEEVLIECKKLIQKTSNMLDIAYKIAPNNKVTARIFNGLDKILKENVKMIKLLNDNYLDVK